MVAGGRDKAFTAAARKHMLRQQCWVTPVRWMTEQLLSLLGGGGVGAGAGLWEKPFTGARAHTRQVI